MRRYPVACWEIKSLPSAVGALCLCWVTPGAGVGALPSFLGRDHWPHVQGGARLVILRGSATTPTTATES